MLRAWYKLLNYLGITAILRLLANVLLLFAAIAFISDAAKTLRGDGHFVLTPAGAHFQELSPSVFAMFRTWVEETLPAFAWEPVLQSVLQVPTWGLFAGLAVLFLWLGRRRQQVNVFVN